MERPTSNNLTLKQMDSYNFDAPFKVILLFEDEETDQPTNKPINDRVTNSADIFKEKCADLQKRNKKSDICFPDICFDNMETVYNREHEESGAEYSNTNQKEFIGPALENNHTEIRQTNPNHSLEQSIHSANKTGARDKTRLFYMLDQVSNNLIEISKCYCNTFHPEINKNCFFVPQAELNYNSCIEHFFRLSYDTVVKIFLPQENNPYFIAYFITRTIALAKSKLWDIDKDFLRRLITSLITWAKKKKRNCDGNQIENTYRVSCQSQKNIIQKHNKVNPNPNKQPAENDDICNFSYRPQNQEIKLSTDPGTLQNTLSPQNNLPDYQIKQKDTSTVHFLKRPSNFEVNKQFEKRMRTETETRIPNILPSMPLTVHPYPDSQRDESTGIESHYFISENELTTRPSVSRDSGFISPTINTFSPNQMNPNTILPATNMTSTLNSNIPIDRCKFCFSTTFMCPECEVYYCSIYCQESDFIFHELLCRRTQR